jgi:hypothetical protein
MHNSCGSSKEELEAVSTKVVEWCVCVYVRW